MEQPTAGRGLCCACCGPAGTVCAARAVWKAALGRSSSKTHSLLGLEHYLFAFAAEAFMLTIASEHAACPGHQPVCGASDSASAAAVSRAGMRPKAYLTFFQLPIGICTGSMKHSIWCARWSRTCVWVLAGAPLFLHLPGPQCYTGRGPGWERAAWIRPLLQ